MTACRTRTSTERSESPRRLSLHDVRDRGRPGSWHLRRGPLLHRFRAPLRAARPIRRKPAPNRRVRIELCPSTLGTEPGHFYLPHPIRPPFRPSATGLSAAMLGTHARPEATSYHLGIDDPLSRPPGVSNPELHHRRATAHRHRNQHGCHSRLVDIADPRSAARPLELARPALAPRRGGNGADSRRRHGGNPATPCRSTSRSRQTQPQPKRRATERKPCSTASDSNLAGLARCMVGSQDERASAGGADWRC